MGTYWNSDGRYQSASTRLSALVPREGAVVGFPALERFRRASNAYYDIYNNGGCNLSKEDQDILGIAVKADEDGPSVEPGQLEAAECAMDRIIIEAAGEQWAAQAELNRRAG